MVVYVVMSLPGITVVAGAARGVPAGRHHGAREAGRGVRRDGRQRRRQGELRRVQGGHAEGQRPPGRRPLVPPASGAGAVDVDGAREIQPSPAARSLPFPREHQHNSIDQYGTVRSISIINQSCLNFSFSFCCLSRCPVETRGEPRWIHPTRWLCCCVFLEPGTHRFAR